MEQRENSAERMGSGSFHTVVGKGDTVYRIAVVNEAQNKSYLRNLRRGVSIPHYLRRSVGELTLGPSLAKRVSPSYETMSVLPADFVAALDPIKDKAILNINRDNSDSSESMFGKRSRTALDMSYGTSVFFVSTMERLQKIAPFPEGDPTWFTDALYLSWFLAAAELGSGFAHRDIKPGNIAYRPNTEYHEFQIGKNIRLGANPSFVPVFLDFDFSTVHLTEQREALQVAGTVFYSAPETVFENVNYPNMRLRTVRTTGIYLQAAACDWFSLGYSMYLRAMGSKGEIFSVPSKFTKAETACYETYLHLTYVINTPQEAERVRIYLSEHYPHAMRNLRNAVDMLAKDNNPIAERLVRRFNALAPNEKEFLRRAMHIDPFERIFRGNVKLYMNFFQNDVRFAPPTKPTFVYSMPDHWDHIGDAQNYVGRDDKDIYERYPYIAHHMECALETLCTVDHDTHDYNEHDVADMEYLHEKLQSDNLKPKHLVAAHMYIHDVKTHVGDAFVKPAFTFCEKPIRRRGGGKKLPTLFKRKSSSGGGGRKLSSIFKRKGSSSSSSGKGKLSSLFKRKGSSSSSSSGKGKLSSLFKKKGSSSSSSGKGKRKGSSDGKGKLSSIFKKKGSSSSDGKGKLSSLFKRKGSSDGSKKGSSNGKGKLSSLFKKKGSSSSDGTKKGKLSSIFKRKKSSDGSSEGGKKRNLFKRKGSAEKKNNGGEKKPSFMERFKKKKNEGKSKDASKKKSQEASQKKREASKKKSQERKEASKKKSQEASQKKREASKKKSQERKEASQKKREDAKKKSQERKEKKAQEAAQKKRKEENRQSSSSSEEEAPMPKKRDEVKKKEPEKQKKKQQNSEEQRKPEKQKKKQEQRKPEKQKNSEGKKKKKQTESEGKKKKNTTSSSQDDSSYSDDDEMPVRRQQQQRRQPPRTAPLFNFSPRSKRSRVTNITLGGRGSTPSSPGPTPSSPGPTPSYQPAPGPAPYQQQPPSPDQQTPSPPPTVVVAPPSPQPTVVVVPQPPQPAVVVVPEPPPPVIIVDPEKERARTRAEALQKKKEEEEELDSGSSQESESE